MDPNLRLLLNNIRTNEDYVEASDNSSTFSEPISDFDNSDVESEHDLTIETEQDTTENDHPVIALSNYPNDIEHEEDFGENWTWLENDNLENPHPLHFLFNSKNHGLNIDITEAKPEDYFNALFENTMWTEICDATNAYAAKRKAKLGKDVIQHLDNPNYKRNSRLNTWKTVTEKELKIWVAHLIVMGLVRKTDIEKYWSLSELTRTPFFGSYMKRDRFQGILWNFHLNDDSLNPRYGQENHDALAKLRNFLDMCCRTFQHTYSPLSNLSLDEGCCPWKGRLRFKCYNPNKPAKFHIKLFQLCEAKSGYCLGFNVYTGKDSCHNENVTLNPQCTTTTKVVMTLCDQCNVLNKGHCIYFDNYYSSPELFEELLYRETLACGTVRANRKNLPKAVTQAKLSKGQCCFRRKLCEENEQGTLLALKWFDKRPVYMLSSKHFATEQWTGKYHYKDKTPIYKPTAIIQYTDFMSGVDKADQLMNNYHFLRKTVKWWRKLWVHMMNMLIMNAYILNKKFGKTKLTHVEYREYIAKYLLKGASQESDEENAEETQSKQHYIVPIGKKPGNKIQTRRRCVVCSVGKKKNKLTGEKMVIKRSSYKCFSCNVPLCTKPCFAKFHREMKNT